MSSSDISKGLGQLEAYIGALEGVAFEMDNEYIWDSYGGYPYNWPIFGMAYKSAASRFTVTQLPSGEVMLKNWEDMYVAPVPLDTDPDTHHLHPVPYLSPEDESLLFEVFYRDNKIAFLAYNGLFLARIYRFCIQTGCFLHAVDAAKEVADDSCFFRPFAADSPPDFEIIKVSSCDLSEIKYEHCVLKRETLSNRTNKPTHVPVTMQWWADVTDKIAWKHLWGLGVAISCKVKINGMSSELKYTKDNEKVVSVSRIIKERLSKDVVIPPKSVCTISFLVEKNDSAVFRFKATIRKKINKGNVSTMCQPGVWSGVVYRDIRLDVKIEPLGWDLCNTM